MEILLKQNRVPLQPKWPSLKAEPPRNKLVFDRFSKNSPETFRSRIYSGLFLARLHLKSVSQKARKCSELSSNILEICSVKPISKGHSRGWAQLDYYYYFFSGIKLNTYFTLEPSCWFLQCFHIMSLTIKACRISLDYWLELEWTWNGAHLHHHRVRMLTNNMNCHYGLVTKHGLNYGKSFADAK